jgi:SAM-dependent methyltransferase
VTHPEQQSDYSFNLRPEVVPHLPSGVASVLDVGCGRGGFGTSLRARYGPGARLVGVEAVPEQAERARAAGGFDEVIEGYFPDVVAGRDERFDLITFNDVLEHVVDPWGVLDRCRGLLAPGGAVLATIPNVAYAPVVWGLARGRWEYSDEGVLDRTHVRFFTQGSMRGLFESSGYTVERCVGINSIGGVWVTDPLAPRRWAKRVVERAIGDSRYLHFVLVGRPRG